MTQPIMTPAVPGPVRPAKEYSQIELIALFGEIAGRYALYDTKEMHDRYWECRRELEARAAVPEVDAPEPFCWYTTTRTITDEYETVYSEDGERPKGGGDWKPLYAAQPSPLVAPRRYRMAEMFSKMVEDENGDWVRFDSLDMNNGERNG